MACRFIFADITCEDTGLSIVTSKVEQITKGNAVCKSRTGECTNDVAIVSELAIRFFTKINIDPVGCLADTSIVHKSIIQIIKKVTVNKLHIADPDNWRTVH